MSLAPQSAQPFSLDDDSDVDLPTVTARSSPMPRSSTPPVASSSQVPYRDSVDQSNPNPIFDYDPDAPEAPKYGDPASFYPPQPTKSNQSSREAQFELDGDELSQDEEPLLMEGMIATARARASGDLPIAARVRKSLDQIGERPLWLDKGAGVLAGIANMSNSILGAGIIGLPYALREAGFFTGLVLLICLGVVTDWTIRLIVLNAKMSGRTTYIDIMDTCFGHRGRAAVSFFQFTFAFGGMCAFCVILGDTIPHVLESILPGTHTGLVGFLISRPVVVSFLTLGISYPLSLYRDIENLSKASALALVSMVVIVVTVAVRGPGVEYELKGDRSQRWTFLESGFFEAIGVISFAFVCHHNSLLIYGSLRTPTIDRFARVTHVSTMVSVFACLCMSTSGFLVFTDKTQGNILNNFADDDALINVARACFGANMFATLPLEAFVCREVMETYFWPGADFDKKRHVVITSSLVGLSLFVSLITHDLGLILELAGGFSATALAYIFPAACFLKLSGAGTKSGQTRLAAYACCLFGLVVMVLSTVGSIKKALNKEALP